MLVNRMSVEASLITPGNVTDPAQLRLPPELRIGSLFPMTQSAIHEFAKVNGCPCMILQPASDGDALNAEKFSKMQAGLASRGNVRPL